MLSKNNLYKKTQNEAKQVPHYGLRKLSIGVASVLLSTTLYFGVNAQADVVSTGNSTNSVTTQEPENSSADNQAGKSIVLSHHQDATGEENAQNVNGNSSSTDSERLCNQQYKHKKKDRQQVSLLIRMLTKQPLLLILKYSKLQLMSNIKYQQMLIKRIPRLALRC